MEAGIIGSPHELSWTKGVKKKFFGRAFFHQGSIVLSELSLLSGSAVEAHICKDCKKLIINYADPDSDLNFRNKLEVN